MNESRPQDLQMPGETLIFPDDARLQYVGRIDDADKKAPRMSWVLSGIHFGMRGRHARLLVRNTHGFWQNALGVVVNGRQSVLPLQNDVLEALDLGPFLTDGDNDVTVFKRMDACHLVTFYGIITGEPAALFRAPSPPSRRMEVYGDSVSAGEVCEAAGYMGLPDPSHNGQYSNGYMSYAGQAARLLHAQCHNIAQGGISLQDGRGYFHAPDTLGMLSCFDKTAYNPALGPVKAWNFSRYHPHVVIVALGQNDAHPDDFMKDDPDGEKALRWKEDYAFFVTALRAQYPNARILLTTTLLMHDPSWDRAIGEVADTLRQTDEKIYHFLYSRNGAATPGHPRIPEHAEMARELSAFIESLGESVWRDGESEALGIP